MTSAMSVMSAACVLGKSPSRATVKLCACSWCAQPQQQFWRHRLLCHAMQCFKVGLPLLITFTHLTQVTTCFCRRRSWRPQNGCPYQSTQPRSFRRGWRCMTASKKSECRVTGVEHIPSARWLYVCDACARHDWAACWVADSACKMLLMVVMMLAQMMPCKKLMH